MNEIIVHDKTSLDGITLGLAINGYFVTTDVETDDSFKTYYKISYCEKEYLKDIISKHNDNIEEV